MSESAVVDNILLHATGAVREAVRSQLLLTAKEFCTRSGAWIEDVVITLNGASSYLIPLPSGVGVSQIDGCAVNGYPLSPVSLHGGPFTGRGAFYTFHLSTGRVEFADPADSGTAVLRVWAKPTDLGDVPDFLYENYEEALEAGTLSRLMQQPDRPYTNPALAALHHRRFVRQCTLAKRESLGGFSRSSLGWRFPHATRSRSLRR